MNILGSTIAFSLLAIASHITPALAAKTNSDTADLSNIAFGFCSMNANFATTSAINFPDGSSAHGINNCSDMLKTAFERGYNKIVSATASGPNGASPSISYVISADKISRPAAVVFCWPNPNYSQTASLDLSNGDHFTGSCAQVLKTLKDQTYSVVPELTVSAGGTQNFTGYVLVK